jgi:hypothetical protein
LHELTGKSSLVLSDGHFRLDSSPVACVVAISYDAGREQEKDLKELKKEGQLVTLHIPVFSWNECVHFSSVCADPSKLDGWKSRYERWGGIPRHLFARIDEATTTGLESAFEKPSLESLQLWLSPFGQCGIPIRPSGAVHDLFHVKVKGEREDSGLTPSDPFFYDLAGYELGSREIESWLLRRYTGTDRLRLHSFIERGIGHPAFECSAGKLFERVALNSLRNGRFLVVRMGSCIPTNEKVLKSLPELTYSDLLRPVKEPKTNQLPSAFYLKSKLKLVEFDSFEECKSKAKATCYVPKSHSFCAVDAFLPFGIPAKVTTDPSRAVLFNTAAAAAMTSKPKKQAQQKQRNEHQLQDREAATTGLIEYAKRFFPDENSRFLPFFFRLSLLFRWLLRFFLFLLES